MYIPVNDYQHGEHIPTEIRALWNDGPFCSRFPNDLRPSIIWYHGNSCGRSFDTVQFTFSFYSPGDVYREAQFLVPSDVVAFGRVSCGWPSLAMIGDVWKVVAIDHSDRLDLRGQCRYVGAIESIRQPDDTFDFIFFDLPFLPVRATFPGFAINTIFYAAVLWAGLWVVFAVPVKVRRWRRIKRGQCASCGYSLRGHDASGGEKCPECGATA
jgi:hypothetical protein